MNQNSTDGARARRGAGDEPKRKRAREDRSPNPKADPAVDAVAQAKAKADRASNLAKIQADPAFCAIRVIAKANSGGFGKETSPDWTALTGALLDSSEKLRKGDLSGIEDMLLFQAITLQSLFARLSEEAIGCTTIPSYDLKFRYALRAQAQCRASLETLAAIKNPPVVVARQANVTTGPQQINNGVAPLRARESASGPNELSGEAHELHQDTRTPALARPTDSPMAPVGAIDGTEDGSGQSEVVSQRLEGRMASEATGTTRGAGRAGGGD